MSASNGEASSTQYIAPLPIPERKNSQYEDPNTAGLGVGLGTQARRRSNVSGRLAFRDSVRAEDLESLTRTASAISGHQDAFLEAHGESGKESENGKEREREHATISFPKAAKPGPISTIRELPSEFNTPYSTRPPSPNTPGSRSHRHGLGAGVGGDGSPREYFEVQIEEPSRNLAETSYPDIGAVKSLRGALILLTTCGAQLMDNVFMTGVNISLPAVQKEFGAKASDLQWLISAYTLTFGGFLLLAGVLSDRFGRKLIFCIGMLWISIWTIANGFATSFIQLAIFRALQGIGAAMTVPSAVGIISSYFVAKDRTIALSFFAASGAVGFCAGLIFGGFLTGSLGWRYLFYVSTALTGSLGVLGQWILPKDRLEGQEKPSLDLLGAGLSTGGLILLSFVLSSGGVYGWSKAFIIVLLILSVAVLGIFVYVEKRASHPIMPLSLWKIQNFAALWISGFVCYGGYQTVLYYIVLIAQEVNRLSPGTTALYFLPMGATGFIFSMSVGKILERYNTKNVLLIGMLMMMTSPIPAALLTSTSTNFFSHVLPTSLLVVAAVTIVYCSCTIILLESVPTSVKSLCGGMINTAFQIGSGVGLALSSAVVQAVDTNQGKGIIEQYCTGLWFCVAFGGVGFVASAVGVRNSTAGRFGGRRGDAEPVAFH
ncbi:hypothetical protein MFRU_002g03150 [Monilinia fructicola]|uniref:Major facilitator superfamily (MFS) profile domain-containing protein n=1 Tax=Monilinia fructicola TaxID=38448 RepID=A0A5M9K2D4_MONFR|nr:hypothetical protein EYC84_004288 [Monilinia fructicola]KAG4034966.1 hypothetical protein MFRU_002g03150 [Monilinia fructicola]